MASILLLFFSLYFSGSEAATLRIGQPVLDYYIKNYKEKCLLTVSEAESFQRYVQCKGDTIITKYPNICIALIQHYSKMHCSDDFQKDVGEFLKKDLIPYHKEALSEIKEEIRDFKSKNLSASFQIQKYLNFKEANNVDESVQLDPAIIEMAKNEEEKFLKRQDTCSDVMNLKEPLSLKAPKDQGGIGWCYAYASSDLIAHATGKDPSAIHLSTLMNGKFLPNLIGLKKGGLMEWTIEEMFEKGMCLEKDLPSADVRFSNPDRNMSHVFDESIELSKKYKNYATNEQLMITPEQYTKDSIKKELCSSQQNFLKDIFLLFPSLKMDQISEILLAKWSTDAFKAMVDTVCPTTKDPEFDNLKVKNSIFNKYSTLDEQLDKGNILGILYDGGTLRDYKSKDIRNIHASTIIGRRFNKKTMSCEYLLRNSWGKDCGEYSQDYECKTGHLWIGEEFFKYNNNLYEVVYIEKK